MTGLPSAAIVAFGVVFLAELGDKTQLLALGFGARHSLRQVVLGLLVGYGIASLLAVAVGGVLGATLPERPIEVVGGFIFLGFAVAAFLDDDDEEGDGLSKASRVALLRSSVVASIGFAILVAEMGDKTQIATATLASQRSAVGTWLGATLGETASGMVGALAGTLIGDRISPQRLKIASAVLFAAFGIVMILGVF